MFKQTKRFLLASVSFLIVLCITIFIWIGIYMNKKSEVAIGDIGKIYMSEMSKQLQQKFDAIIDLRLSQMDGIVLRTPPYNVKYSEELMEELAVSTEIRGFTYLGLYTYDGNSETVYGEPVTAFDQEELLEVLQTTDKKVTSGYNEKGERFLLLTYDVQYPMADGRLSDVMVAGLPMEYLDTALVLEENDSMVYYHIIRSDGTFVIRSGDAYRDNYFSRVMEMFSEYNGKTSEQYAEELKESMEKGKNYSTLLQVDGVRRHMYCSLLPDSEWYLVAVMPYGVLDDALSRLEHQRQYTILGACGLILLAVLVIFILYYRMSQQQLRELNQARREAIQAKVAR